MRLTADCRVAKKIGLLDDIFLCATLKIGLTMERNSIHPRLRFWYPGNTKPTTIIQLTPYPCLSQNAKYRRNASGSLPWETIHI